MAKTEDINATGALFTYSKGKEVKGTWFFGGKEHDAIPCKNTLSYLLGRLFDPNAIYVRSATHTFKIAKKAVGKESLVALKALQKSPTIVHASSQEEITSETMQLVNTNNNIHKEQKHTAVKKLGDGSFQTVSFTTTIPFSEECNTLAFAAIDHPGTLQSITLPGGHNIFCIYKEGSALAITSGAEVLTALQEKSQTTYEDLIETARSTGKASVLFSHNNHLLRLNVTDTNGTIQASCTAPEINLEQLSQAGYSEEKLQQVKKTIDQKITLLYASIISGNQKTVQMRLTTNSHDYVLLHVKKDGTVTIGLRKSFDKGRIKKIQAMYRFGIRMKKRALALPTASTFEPALSEQIESMKRLKAHHHIVQVQKTTDKTIETISEITGERSAEKVFGFQMDLYQEGTVEDLAQRPYEASELPERIQIALDIAEGLQNIHAYEDEKKQNYVVIDVKPANVLLYKDPQGKLHAALTDLTLNPEGSKNALGTIAFTPPELLRAIRWKKTPVSISQRNDVWAFGMTLFSLIHPQQQTTFFPGISSFLTEQQFLADYHDMLAYLAEFDKQHPGYKNINDIIRKALALDPSKRPTMEKIVSQLLALK